MVMIVSDPDKGFREDILSFIVARELIVPIFWASSRAVMPALFTIRSGISGPLAFPMVRLRPAPILPAEWVNLS